MNFAHFFVFELSHNPVNCRKLIETEMIIAQRSKWILSDGDVIDFSLGKEPVLYLLANSFQHLWLLIYVSFLWILPGTSLKHLICSFINNELHKHFDTWLVYMRIIALHLFKKKKDIFICVLKSLDDLFFFLRYKGQYKDIALLSS